MLEKLTEITKNIYQNELLSNHSTFKIGGKCDFLACPETVGELTGLIRFLKENGEKYFVMGNGSNILFPDGGFAGVIVKTARLNELTFSGGTVVAGAGLTLSRLCDFTLKNSLGGLQDLSGIPGTVGGAVYMNAGAYSGEIKDTLVCSYYLDENFDIVKLSAENHKFSYRHSFFSGKKHIILKSEFGLSEGDGAALKERASELLKRRSQKQPLNYPSCGSAFKRPPNDYASRLIQESGLKGYTVGGAQVSEKHSGFVINIGGATANDARKLIEHIKNTVYNKFGVMLEEEIIIL
jgi:UDP-N-acetylmuramate dehydrogenase